MSLIDNRYAKWYYTIIENAKPRQNDGYVEKHHIIPRCIGGSDTEDNIVLLTYREHYLCHWLLTKFSTGRTYRKMCTALGVMSGTRTKNADLYDRSKQISSWQYDRSKRAFRDGRVGVPMSDEQRKKLSDIGKTKVGSLSNSWGYKHSDESRQKMREAKTGKRNHNFGKKRPEFAAKMRGRKMPITHTCLGCKQSFPKGIHNRYHGPKCKMIMEITNF